MVTGCVTTVKNYQAESQPAEAVVTEEPEKIAIKEIDVEEPAQEKTIQEQFENEHRPPKLFTYHRVKQGETLWAISGYYNVSLKDLIKANHVKDPKAIKAGQLLKIPMEKREVELSLGRFEWPLYGRIISHYEEDLSGKPNNGIDIEPEGSYVVHASKEGRVEFSQHLKGYGYTIILKHPQGLNTIYSNLSSSFVNEEGQVASKQALGEVGKDVRTQQAFLHFEIRKDDKPLNPLRYLP